MRQNNIMLYADHEPLLFESPIEGLDKVYILPHDLYRRDCLE